MDDARKPIIVAIVVGVVVVLLFVFGVGFGGGGDAGAVNWQDRLAGIGNAGALSAEDVALGGGCGRDGGAIVFSGECTVLSLIHI